MIEQEISPRDIDRMQETIREIGLARFVGRINSGLIEPEVGYRAVDCYVAKQSERPLLSKLTHFILGKTDPTGCP